MTEKLMNILDQYTSLTKDVDLFYLEMPLSKSGAWFADRSVQSARTDYRDYDIYYRGKTKQSAIQNIEYLKNTIDNLTQCEIDGETFRLRMENQWEYLEKDSEGYFVFANVVRLV